MYMLAKLLPKSVRNCGFRSLKKASMNDKQSQHMYNSRTYRVLEYAWQVLSAGLTQVQDHVIIHVQKRDVHIIWPDNT